MGHKCGINKKSALNMLGVSPLNRVAEGGMSAKERAAYNRETGGDIKAPQPEGGPRKKSYCARSAGIKKCQDPDENGDCPNDIARRKWKC
tara:strand:+ start:283 stop:552 length:270 start_codon:yes stop_codon:yes gene_type:complete